MSRAWTIGHSNRPFEEFVELLEEQGIGMVLDVRAHAGSRKHPQFGRDLFPVLLGEHGIRYEHEPDLGGRRREDPAAPVASGGAWRNASFRAYAQHAQTPAFREAIDRLMALAEHERVVICCSEAVPWRCHRWLISDVLVARGVEVRHVIGRSEPRMHSMTPFARVAGGQVHWPPEGSTPAR